jgi:hypothetical protein
MPCPNPAWRLDPAALADSLLDSLDTEVDEDPKAAWANEVIRPVAPTR